MIRKLLLLLIVLPLFCAGQTVVKNYYSDINYKDVIELNKLICYRADSTLVTGKVIRYNKKNKPKKYIIISKGKPIDIGWTQISDDFVRPESDLGDLIKGALLVTDLSMAVTGNDLYIPEHNPDNTVNEFKNILNNQNDYTIKAYDEMSERNDIAKNLNSNEDKSNGYLEEYNENGKLRINGSLIEDKKNGTWEEYFDNGQLKSKGNYIKGRKNGFWQEYHENGQLLCKINYRDGKENGIIEVYHKNGQLMIKGLFKDAIEIGEWNYYDESGKLIKTEKFDK